MEIIKGVSLILIGIYLSACSQINFTPQQPPEAIGGVLNLQDWDFEKDGSINLSGEWLFFWDELLQPNQITTLNEGHFVSVPRIWSDYTIEGITTSTEGYATYILTLYPPNAHQTYGLYIEGQGSAYELWVDGHLLAENGRIGTEQEAMTPGKNPITVFFRPDAEKVKIVLLISNFHHRKGGFRNNISLGLAESVHQEQMQNWFLEAFSVGVLFVMGLYHWFIYKFRDKNKAPLYFAILSWMMAIRVGLTNQNTLMLHLPQLSWALALRIEYLTFFLSLPLFSLFLKSLYPKDIHRWFIRLTFGLGFGFSLYMVFTDTLSLSYTPKYYQIIILLEMIYRKRSGGGNKTLSLLKCSIKKRMV
ncbi:MAG: hypothetical protein HN922_12825 [Anaerolineae bacterium]|jgi:hypothetical protein|nr:hypothetical protein [Anaerolineae bacterium]MBT7783709.1 hypothetical protein [Anaerolineae bacterium]